MKQALQLKLGQSLTMTPQLQQAIRLLQLSSLEMQQEIQEALDSNPMLELEEEGDGGEHEAPAAQEEGDDPDAFGDDSSAEYEGPSDYEPEYEAAYDVDDGSPDSEWSEAIPEELPVDASWDEVYSAPAGPAPAASDDDYDFDSRNEASESLTDQLRWQLNLTRLSSRDLAIADALIDALNADGFLTLSIDELLESFEPALEIEEDEVIAVLHRLQQFDPPGMFARSLGESLLLQLREFPEGTPALEAARLVLSQHLDLLASRDYATLMRRTRLSEAALGEALRLIQSLNPRPAAQLAPSDTEYVVPDVLVRRHHRRWLVELNAEATPKLRIHSGYASLVRRADSSADNQFLKDHLQEARWFLKSLQSRNETLLKVAQRIVEHQRGFLEFGPEAMKPLVLAEIADAIGMHESTISRVTTRKYMHTPRGVFELKYFFSSHVGTSTGGEVSSTAIRALIRKLTDEENPKKPLSDAKIAKLLAEQNIEVARRTIAKYRESLAIPPSNERKRLI
ncbi:MAG: polymerase sigma-54 factor [Pseudomonadota bacterium]|jgi:RNA polymerase sigma-54 factor